MVNSDDHEQELELDEMGFLKDATTWTHNMALLLAESQGIDALSDSHWKLLDALRSYYFEYGVPPALSNICWENGMNKYCLPDLFSNSKIAWMIAGLPDPGEEAKSYMSDW